MFIFTHVVFRSCGMASSIQLNKLDDRRNLSDWNNCAIENRTSGLAVFELVNVEAFEFNIEMATSCGVLDTRAFRRWAS
ncbi:hypothetical protein M3Y94_00106500 [Aphelenchoides besseyi]|nr:hypothetical protein M3Y94_00106500 [Aphelenchoides besseyi]